MTYSFRFFNDKKKYSFSIIKLFNLLLIIYLILFLLLILILNIFSFIDITVICLIFIRGIYLCIINIYRVFFRLNTNPAYIFVWSIPVQIITALTIFIFFLFDKEINLNYFFFTDINFFNFLCF